MSDEEVLSRSRRKAAAYFDLTSVRKFLRQKFQNKKSGRKILHRESFEVAELPKEKKFSSTNRIKYYCEAQRVIRLIFYITLKIELFCSFVVLKN